MLVAMTSGELLALITLVILIFSIYFHVKKKTKVIPVIAETVEDVNKEIDYDSAQQHNERLRRQRRHVDDVKVYISFQEPSAKIEEAEEPEKKKKHVLEGYTLKDYIKNSKECDRLLTPLRTTY
jgi:type IV secretory pathway VirB4 component